jgi:heat shock protein HslJ
MAAIAVVATLATAASACGGDDDDATTGRDAGIPATADDLQDQSWELKSLSTDGGADLTAVSKTDPATASFSATEISGTTGCNQYSGSYDLEDGGAISFGTMATTKKACSDDLNDQEQAFLSGLSNAAHAVIADDETLQFLDDSDVVIMVFQPGVSLALEGPVWSLVDYRTPTAVTSVLAGTTVTAEFDAGQMSGNGGCNDYSAQYTGGDESGNINIGPVAATQKLCPDTDGVDQQELEYFSVLDTVATFQVDGNSLTLFDAQGRDAATYQVAPSSEDSGSGSDSTSTSTEG